MREQKVSINSHLPDDTMLEILARLPIKSLLRFRCVCKSWNSYLSSPYFIAFHLENSQDFLLHFPRKNKRQICTVACNCTYDRIFEFAIPFNFPSGSAHIVGSCNGLICLRDSRRYMSPDLICLWNPSIRNFKILPSPSFCDLNWIAYGFAYDSVTDDYKIVGISFTKETDDYNEIRTSPHRAEVYTLRSDSWRSVDDIPLRPNVLLSYQWDSLSSAPLVGGALHWMLETVEADYDGEKRSEMIVSFDVSNNKFGEIELTPGRLAENRSDEYLGEYKGKLALFFIHFRLDGPAPGTKCSIWVMNDYGVAESWTKLIVVQFHRESVSLFGCTENGGLVIYRRPDDSDKRRWKTVVFDPETSYEKNLDNRYIPIIITTFKESLVSLCGTNVYNQDTN